MNSTIKIFLVYHKKDFLLKDEILTPIHAGRALSLKYPGKNKDLDWLQENMIGDDTGDNISEKNSSYNELTAIYWVWKNYKQIGDPKYIGFMHYRRHFMFREEKYSCIEFDEIEDTYFDKISYSPEKMLTIIDGYDFICPKPQWRTSMYEHFKRNHRIEDLERVIRILKEKYPKFSSAADIYLSGQKAYFCNMFVMPKEMFFDYAKYIFDILFEFERQVDITGKRLFISEWLTGIYITNLLEQGHMGRFFPTVTTEGPHTIPILLSSSEDYVIPLSVTMVSILENARNATIFDFYILVSDRFNESLKEKIYNLKLKYPRCNITFISQGDVFDNVVIKIKHLSKETYFRLLCADLFPELSKIIYLDVDVIVKQDLSVLYRISLNDYYIAGVKAAAYYYPEEWKRTHSKEIGIPIDQYINAGVLLIDLVKLRKNRMTRRFLDLVENNYSSDDQDIINIACYNQIKHLHMKYNVMTKYLNEGDDNNKRMYKVFDSEEIKEALNNPVIIHYVDKIKPWHDPNSIWADQWWQYAVFSPFWNDPAMSLNQVFEILKKQRLKFEKVQKELIEVRNQLDNQNEKVFNLHRQLRDVYDSITYKTGKAITFIPRNMIKTWRCYKGHGLKYTLEKIKSRIKKYYRIINGKH